MTWGDLLNPEKWYEKAGDVWNGTIGKLTGESAEQAAQRNQLEEHSKRAGMFADQNQGTFSALGPEANAQRDFLRRQASGQNSISAEQLRQGLQQNLAGQRSMAAGASPANAGMAARTAAIQSGRLGGGMAGQQALAGLQERQQANQALTSSIMGQRQQDLQAALGSRQNAVAGLGAFKPQGNESELGAATGLIGGALSFLSDRRVKRDIKSGRKDADDAIKGLRAYVYQYKDQGHGKGPRLGIMAQDLEKVGLKHAVMETPEGKAVHGGHLTASNTAMIARLGERLSQLERGK